MSRPRAMSRRAARPISGPRGGGWGSAITRARGTAPSGPATYPILSRIRRRRSRSCSAVIVRLLARLARLVRLVRWIIRARRGLPGDFSFEVGGGDAEGARYNLIGQKKCKSQWDEHMAKRREKKLKNNASRNTRSIIQSQMKFTIMSLRWQLQRMRRLRLPKVTRLRDRDRLNSMA